MSGERAGGRAVARLAQLIPSGGMGGDAHSFLGPGTAASQSQLGELPASVGSSLMGGFRIHTAWGLAAWRPAHCIPAYSTLYARQVLTPLTRCRCRGHACTALGCAAVADLQ